MDHTYQIESAECLKRKLDETEEKLKSYQSKVYIATRKAKRLKSNVNCLQETLKLSFSKFQINDSKQEQILSAASKIAVNLLDKSQSKKNYDSTIRRFALTLHFYSPKAYKFVRQTFGDNLPHEKTLHRWCCKLDAEPGFTEQAFHFIEKRIKTEKQKMKDLVFSVSFDEMKIMKCVSFVGKKMVGCVDLGFEVSSTCDAEPATDVLVFMVNCVNSNWKLPVGYFLINSLSSDEITNLVKICMKKLDDISAKVCSLTCDGPPSHISMAGKLGACLKPETLSSHLVNLNSEIKGKVHFVLDPSHMLKLVRNTFSDYKSLLYKGEIISWHYIVELYNLQTERGLYLCNKLKASHIYFKNTKMKTKLATQVCSNSVADAIAFARDILKLPQFVGSEETCRFLRLMNDCFDIQNSHNVFGYDYKSPLKPETKDIIFARQQEITKYLYGVTDTTGRKLLDGPRKTGFLGNSILIYLSIFN